jgi:hypothetical protein
MDKSCHVSPVGNALPVAVGLAASHYASGCDRRRSAVQGLSKTNVILALQMHGQLAASAATSNRQSATAYHKLTPCEDAAYWGWRVTW